MHTSSSARAAGPAQFTDNSHERTSIWSKSYPRYCFWKREDHPGRSDSDIRRLHALKRTAALKRRASRDVTALLKYVASGQRRGPVLGYAFISEDLFSIEGGTNLAQYTAARRLASMYIARQSSQNAEIANWVPGERRTITAPARPMREPENGPTVDAIFTKLDSGSELPEAMRTPFSTPPSDYLTTSSGQFVSLGEAILGMQVLEPLKRMCTGTYEEAMKRFSDEAWKDRSTTESLIFKSEDIDTQFIHQFEEMTAAAARDDEFAADHSGRQMGLLYKVLPYKHLERFLSDDSWREKEDPFFDHIILLPDDPHKDYDWRCRLIQDQAVEEWRQVAGTRTGSALWRAQMQHNFKSLDAGAREFLRWEMTNIPLRFSKLPPTAEQRYTAMERKLVQKGLLTVDGCLGPTGQDRADRELSDGLWGASDQSWRVEVEPRV